MHACINAWQWIASAGRLLLAADTHNRACQLTAACRCAVHQAALWRRSASPPTRAARGRPAATRAATRACWRAPAPRARTGAVQHSRAPAACAVMHLRMLAHDAHMHPAAPPPLQQARCAQGHWQRLFRARRVCVASRAWCPGRTAQQCRGVDVPVRAALRAAPRQRRLKPAAVHVERRPDVHRGG